MFRRSLISSKRHLLDMHGHGKVLKRWLPLNAIDSSLRCSVHGDAAVKSDVKSLRHRVVEVTNPSQAMAIVQRMREYPKAVWGCDTEVVGIDLDEQGPVGNGKVICASIYGGPDVDVGFGADKIIWIDNAGAAEGTLGKFKDWFEDQSVQKVWHNYGFDRHVMFNEGIDCLGFGGDTMHMARLWDTGRDKAMGGKGYSLESLSALMYEQQSKTGGLKSTSPPLVSDVSVEGIENDNDDGGVAQKISMMQLFGVAKKKKDGEDSKIKVLPPLLDLQTDPQTRERWIDYSSRDALATWQLFRFLEERLRATDWMVPAPFVPTYSPQLQPSNPAASLNPTSSVGFKAQKVAHTPTTRLGNMLEFYNAYLRPFGEILTSMERRGIFVDTQCHLKDAETRARAERAAMEARFREWASQHCKDAAYLNPASTAQMQQLFFGVYENRQLKEPTKVFKIEKSEAEYESERAASQGNNKYIEWGVAELKSELKLRGLGNGGKTKKADLMSRLLLSDSLGQLVAQHGNGEDPSDLLSDPSHPLVAQANAEVANMLAQNQSKVSKHRDITISTIGLAPVDFTPGGQPQVSAGVLRKLAGKNLFGDDKEVVWGTAFEFFGRGEEAKRACRAIGALANLGQIDATITNFLVPLQALTDSKGRIHCSLNLNTETGRLSSRRPNLQNQPALEKDQYKIRDAFTAEPGNTLIVADYSQLELRILAHMTNCKSMIHAFASGGCFHSRTAVGMYPYIKEAVDTGKVLLEWDSAKGQRPKEIGLVKDVYAAERRKAKTLNFSIAYGKTVHGLAADWGISTEEADQTLQAWYADRPEVQEWQNRTRALAKDKGFVRTIMGRYRQLPDAALRDYRSGHALRAAINTPIQGSAADVVMMAMLRLERSPLLKKFGYRLLLQIHDEVILEGPEHCVEEALAEVKECMENPFDGIGLSKLLVNLDVDAKYASSWYKAK